MSRVGLILLILPFISREVYSETNHASQINENVDQDVHTETEGCGCSSTSRKSAAGTNEETPTRAQTTTQSSPSTTDPFIARSTNQMSYIEGGSFLMGSDNPILIADGEGPARRVDVSSFWMDIHEVSNQEFELFVNNTGYVTEAEKFGNSFALETYISENVKQNILQAVAGAPWWLPVNNTDWRHPYGPDTDITTIMDHPVVHVSWNDAVAYCSWAKKRLPTEAEWEMACRSGKEDRLFPWGNKERPHDEHRMNIWHGENFPVTNDADDGCEKTCPVTEFPAQTSTGLKNMIGNVWEWVQDWWTVRHSSEPSVNPTGPKSGNDKVKKGGSFMCVKYSCYRYRCGARSQNTPDSSASNLGFRCAADTLPDYLLRENNDDDQSKRDEL